MFYKSKDFCPGLKIEIDNHPYIILENKFVNPGKGQAFNKLKLKNLITNSIIIKTIKIGEKLKSTNLIIVDAQFLYQNNDIYFFINIENSDLYEINEYLIFEIRFWIKEGVSYSITIWNDNIISIKPPKFIELKVIESDNTEKKFIIAKNSKNVILETGVIIKTPLFIKENDIIKIDTENKTYISRIN